MTDEKRLLKNENIKLSMQATHEKRKMQVCRSFMLKIDESSLSAKQAEELKMIFVEAKWLWNDILNWSQLNEENKPWNYVIGKTIQVKTKDGFEERKINYLHSQMKQEVQKQLCANIRALATLKKKGYQKPGLLKFKSEVSQVHIKQIQKNWIRGNRIKLPNIHGTVRVNGLDQFTNIPNIEYACLDLLKTPKGYYIKVCTYTNKSEIKTKEKINKILGIDFGCSTSFTTSEGEKINAIIEESERLKLLQKRLARQVEGSNNYRKTVHLIKIEYQKLTNKKNDLANKLVAKFSQYKTVVIQDEQLKNWHKAGHGKAVQHSVLGRVKQKLLTKDNTVVLGSTIPTTKLCTNCGVYHDEMKVWDRTFSCECGINEDRDIHAARNMVWFYENNVGAGSTKLKRVETEALVKAIFNNSSDQLRSVKHEAASL